MSDYETVKEWSREGLRFSIRRGGYDNHHCGYVSFPSRPVKEQGYDGVLTYVPVHGGITLARDEDDGWFRYGFDCAHADDHTNPIVQDIMWLTGECERMAVAILSAAEIEDEYLLAEGDNEKRAELIDAWRERLREQYGIDGDYSSLGQMIRILTGQL